MSTTQPTTDQFADLKQYLGQQFKFMHEQFEYMHGQFSYMHEQFDVMHQQFRYMHEQFDYMHTEFKSIREDLTDLNERFDFLEARVDFNEQYMRDGFERLSSEIGEVKESVVTVQNILDGVVGDISDLKLEFAARNSQYDRQFAQIGAHIGIKFD